MATEYQNMNAQTIATIRSTPSILTCAVAASVDANVRGAGSMRTPNVEFRGTAKRSFDGSPGTQG